MLVLLKEEAANYRWPTVAMIYGWVLDLERVADTRPTPMTFRSLYFSLANQKENMCPKEPLATMLRDGSSLFAATLRCLPQRNLKQTNLIWHNGIIPCRWSRAKGQAKVHPAD